MKDGPQNCSLTAKNRTTVAVLDSGPETKEQALAVDRGSGAGTRVTATGKRKIIKNSSTKWPN